jgi:hypothetical protein
MLDLDNIQHILVTRTPAMTGRYEFLSFGDPAGARAWLSELVDKVQSAADATATMDSQDRWITVAFTWNGLRALGVSESSLASFPDAFREGMAARADTLGDTGANHPDNWVGGLAADDLHAIAILFARNEAEHRVAPRCTPNTSQDVPEFVCCLILTLTRPRRSTMPTIISGSGTGCRNR